ncbi:PepSY domain-containing protein [Shewanella sp. WXL01]|nr:PepSY domain-containing protein [Shewanella sp. WXL01]
MLLLAVPMLIWVVTGSYFVLMDLGYIRGDHYQRAQIAPITVKQLQTQKVATAEQLLALYPSLQYAELTERAGELVYKLYLQGESRWLPKVVSASKPDVLLGKISVQQAAVIASEYLPRHSVASAPPGESEQNDFSAKLITDNPPSELSARYLPVWRVDVNDAVNTSLYISASSGELVTRRHEFWRWFDLFWKWHIMDYDHGEEVDNRLLLVTAATALVSVLAGVVLLWQRRKGYFRADAKGARLRVSSRRVKHLNRQLHYLVGAVVALQLVIWLATGLYFNLSDGQARKGSVNQQAVAHALANSQPDKDKLLTPLQAAKQLQILTSNPWSTLTLKQIGANSVYVFEHQPSRYIHQCQQQTMLDAATGEPFRLSEIAATNIALASFKGAASLADVSLMQAPIAELPKFCDPLWRITLNHDVKPQLAANSAPSAASAQTRVYVHSKTGQVIAHKNADSDLADLMFKLHFMDYLNQGSFNNPFSWIFALLALTLSLSGAYWVVENIRLRRYRFRLCRERL